MPIVFYVFMTRPGQDFFSCPGFFMITLSYCHVLRQFSFPFILAHYLREVGLNKDELL